MNIRSALLCGTFLLTALASTAHANLLVNPSFEQQGDGWTITGDSTFTSKNCGAIPCTLVMNGGFATGDTVASQELALAPGRYIIDFTGYYRLDTPVVPPSTYSTWDPNSVEFCTFVDGAKVNSKSDISSGTVPTKLDTTWNQFHLSWTGNVSSDIGVQIHLSPGFHHNIDCYSVAVDDFTLTATQVVPEPSSIFALLGGLGGTIGYAIRKRK